MTRTPCLTDEEWAAWSATNASMRGPDRVELPCRDCLPAFAAEMIAVGRCAGSPGALPIALVTAEKVARRREQWRAYGQRRRAARLVTA